MRLSRVAVLGFAAFTLSACRDQGLVGPGVDLLRLIPSGGTQVVIQQEPGAEPGITTFVVRVLTRRGDLASYQGAVTFAPGAFELIATSTPTGGDGEMFVVNPQMAAGRIRFAAFATEDFSTDEALRFSVRTLVPLADAQLKGSLEVAGIVGGAALQDGALLASDGLRDARGQLIEH